MEEASVDKTTTKRKGIKSSSTEVKAMVEEQPDAGLPKTKTRGRPKKTIAVTDPAETIKPTTRRTRSDSNSTTIAVQLSTAQPTKPTATTRKKVTFEDLPEHDKENQPLPARKPTNKKDIEASEKGLRAKPVRKHTVAGTRQKAITSMKTDVEKQMPRALTPKKVTQVAKSVTSDDSDEDELNGGKTPVRDLSQSPKRLPKSAIMPSPAKKLDSTSSLIATTSEKASDQVMLMSPPRRPLHSSQASGITESPKRAANVLLFPASSALHAPVDFTVAASQSVLLQSPKRGTLSSSVFAQSTIKSPKSPVKSSLLQSPAKRPYSPMKQIPRAATPMKTGYTSLQDSTTPVEDITITSHFRSSPQRSTKV